MTTMIQAITTSNEQAAPEYRLVCQGLTINVDGQDLTILDLVKRSERVIGDCYASWLVLVERDHSHRDPFVVWTLIAGRDRWHLESGTYCRTEGEAQEAFLRRA